MSEPLSSPRVYVSVFAVLLVLTVVTVLVAQVHLGRFNTVVAVAIAFSKALIVALYFMHLRYSTRLIWIVVLAGLYWLGIMLTLTLGDYLTRGE
jgi:cytochrome c oxidase subunit 4